LQARFLSSSLRLFVFIFAFLCVSAAAVFAADGFAGREAFRARYEKAVASLGLDEAGKKAAMDNASAWLADCKYKDIDAFLAALSDEDIAEIAKTAARSKLVSDDGVPVAEDPAAYGQKTLLSLPFAGTWHVVQGNNGIVSHLKGGREEFAWDFVIVHNQQQANGNANVNETHYCWGQPVRAPAPGIVVFTKNDLDDHLPYTPNPPHVGNHVYIDHGNGELSLLYHLRKGSVMVKVGDKVERGQPVGLCGDTGISMFPHLHFVFYKGTVEKHERMPTRFFGYFTLKHEPRPGEPLPAMKLRLSGVPKRLDFLMNGSELAGLKKDANF